MNIRHVHFFGLPIFLMSINMSVNGGSYADNHADGTLSGWTSKGVRTWCESGGHAVPNTSDQNKKGYLINDYSCADNGTFFYRVKGSGDLNSLDGGAVFRFTDTDHFYFVTITEANASGFSADNTVRLRKNSTEARSGYVTIKDNLDFTGMNNVYAMKIGVTGSTFSFWLNGDYLGQYTDTANPSGSVGYAYDDLTNGYVGFDSSSWIDAASHYVWDISTTGGIQTGGGTWGTNNYWTPFGDAGALLNPWPGKGNSATFAGTDGAYIITVSGVQAVDSMTFLGAVYTLNSGTIDFGSKNGIYIAAGKNACIQSVVNGSAGLSKYGKGTLQLDGTNTYTGVTTVSAGGFIVNGSIAPESPVVVTSGATLGGMGICNGPVTVNGGTISPGSSGAGKLTTGALALNSASILNFDLGAKSDTIAVNGALTLDGTINFTASAGFIAGTYRLITCSGILTDNVISPGACPAGMKFTIVPGNGYIDVAVATGLIQVEPKDTVAIAGRSVSFFVSARGEGTIYYKWLRYPSDSVGNAAILSILSVSPSDTGARFRCVVRDSSGVDSSRWALLAVIDTPRIINQPKDLGLAVGETAIFSLSVNDTAKVSYSWRKAGDETVLGTSPSFAIAAVTTGDSGSYYCIVGNPAGTVTSTTARLVIGDQKPSAAFISAPKSGRAPLEVAFADASVGAVTSRIWNFGDGGTDTSSQPVHVYTIPGHFSVTLIVANANGADTLVKMNAIDVKEGDTGYVNPIEIVTFFDSTKINDTVTAFDGKIIFWKDSCYTDKKHLTDSLEVITISDIPAGMVPVGVPFTMRNGLSAQPFFIGIRIDSLPGNISLNHIRIYSDSVGGYRVNYGTIVDSVRGIVSIKTNGFQRTFIAMADTSPPKVTMYSDTASAIFPGVTLIDSLSISDNIVNVRWCYFYGRGEDAPELRTQGEMCSATTRFSLVIPDTAKVISPESGLRAILVINDGVHYDTVNISRRVVRDESDKLTIQADVWTPIYPTAVLNDKASNTLIKRLNLHNSDLYNRRYLRLYRWINLDENARETDKWVEYDPNRRNICELFSLEPGRMIWLKAFESVRFHLDSGHTLPLKDPFTIDLPPRQWTDFGMPFRFGVRIEEILSASGADVDSVLFYRWKKDEPSGIFETEALYVPGISGQEDRSRVVEYQPCSGYSFFNRSLKTVQLRIPPIPAAMTKALARTAKKSSSSWSTKFVAQLDNGVQIPAVYLGYADGIKRSTYPLSPSFAKLRVSVFDRSTALRYGHYIGEDAKDGLIKELMISNDADTAQTLRYHLEKTGAFPESYTAFCFDAAAKKSDTGGAIVVAPKSIATRWVIIGDAAFQRNFIAVIQPLQFSLHALYPNPSRSVVNIRYTIPFGAQERIGIAIYNALGKKIWEKKMAGLLDAGSHMVTWNGRDDHGCSAGSGLYIVLLTVENRQGKVIRRFEKHTTLLQ